MILTLVNLYRLGHPVCYRGEFLESRPHLFFKVIRVRDRCSNCQTRLKIEPSFYYGSIYVTFALGVGLMLITTIIYWSLSNSFFCSVAFFGSLEYYWF